MNGQRSKVSLSGSGFTVSAGTQSAKSFCPTLKNLSFMGHMRRAINISFLLWNTDHVSGYPLKKTLSVQGSEEMTGAKHSAHKLYILICIHLPLIMEVQLTFL